MFVSLALVHSMKITTRNQIQTLLIKSVKQVPRFICAHLSAGLKASYAALYENLLKTLKTDLDSKEILQTARE